MLLIDRHEPDKIYAAKSAGSLLIGLGTNGYVISSDVTAFQQYTEDYTQVPNGEVIVMSKDGIAHKDMKLGVEDAKKMQKETIDLKPRPGFGSFFEQEVFEQSEACSKALNYGSRIMKNNRIKLGGLEEREDDLKAIDNLVIAA